MTGRIAWLAGIVALVATGVYTALYLYRWEWNRAILVAILFVAAEVGVATAAILRRLRTDASTGAASRDRELAARLARNRPERHHFAWMEEQTRSLSVFVTLLLGAGAVLTVGAWVVDKIATHTAGPTMERSLARRLRPLAFPVGPLVPDDETLLAEAGPYGIEHLEILLGPRP